jgi:hypothetical protein
MSLNYQSGEEIVKGDIVLLGGRSGVIEFVADPLVDDSETRWFVEEYGGGVMISTQDFGPVFTCNLDVDLEFVNRGSGGQSD